MDIKRETGERTRNIGDGNIDIRNLIQTSCHNVRKVTFQPLSQSRFEEIDWKPNIKDQAAKLRFLSEDAQSLSGDTRQPTTWRRIIEIQSSHRHQMGRAV